MSEPVPAVRSKPGEYFVAAERVEVDLQFWYGDAVYEVISVPRRWGAAWMATVRQIEGLRPGIEFRAMLHVGRKVDG
ncbi:hypothetical protein EV644_103108 [Kribbella orskensis]|uniref:KTSC domain-containing protein n=1 Tax=Kribbella orskensis TaxID=2512216 RepID=A0ABY2BP52_9ACTN|nr:MULTISPECIES: hypothetical protein [Kribbella]TCN39806.1 hypothetical protein EV642_106312 [Kribbella sp. VKM Ac-2500]TCO27411.1 hypothetical protein EV644_103108 [Kribbella orskensis]